jgi:signal transduction histidine kinase
VLVGILNSKARAGDIGALVSAAPVNSGDLHRDLERLLVAASGDPTIHLLGADAASEPEHSAGRVRTPVDGDDGRLAVLDHDLSLTSEPEVLDAVVATARLVLDRERLAERVKRQLEEVNASRIRLLAAEDHERRRIERDLHDGVQQQLITAALLLGMALDRDSDAELVRGAAAEVEAATRELRALARGVHPTLVSERGLVAAVESLAERASFPVDVVGEVDDLPTLVGVTAYFVVAEALTNVAKHADARSAIVTFGMRGDDVSVEIADDGRGGVALELGSGVVGLRDRVEAIGGQLDVVSRVGIGTTITALLPVGDRPTPQLLDGVSEVQP